MEYTSSTPKMYRHVQAIDFLKANNKAIQFILQDAKQPGHHTAYIFVDLAIDTLLWCKNGWKKNQKDVSENFDRLMSRNAYLHRRRGQSWCSSRHPT